MKSLMQLLECVLADASTWCRTSTTRDLETITRRVEHEGLSFLTITLPTFAQDFERCLDQGKVDSTCFRSFKKHGSLPRLFSGLTSLVFDRRSGVLLDVVDVHAVFAIRQVCLMLKKAYLSCSGERERKAHHDYVQCEDELREVPAKLQGNRGRNLRSLFRDVSRLCWGSTLQELNKEVLECGLRPRHGPGATAEHVTGNLKWRFTSWHARLEASFPMADYVLPSWEHYRELEGIELVEPAAEPPVRVVSVPKTLKSPRIIAIEPVCMQYTQQAILQSLVPALEKGPYTKNKVNFSSQGPNQRLARFASSTGRLATLDLKEASDRVSNCLVLDMLECTPNLLEAIQACRTTRADVPGQGILTLAKFASMGSALCFPIEAMVFYTIYLVSEIQRLGLRLTPRTLRRVSRGVRIYGDDIIIPVESVQSYHEILELFGFKLNPNKSFWTGKFRESCGADWYEGTRVTPVYCRYLSPRGRQDVSETLSWISMANQFYLNGYWKTSQWVRDWVSRTLKVPLPIVEPESPVHGRVSLSFSYSPERMCPTLHRPLVKGVVSRARTPKSVIDGVPALLKCLAKASVLPFVDALHLERAGRPEYVDIKLRWATPY